MKNSIPTLLQIVNIKKINKIGNKDYLQLIAYMYRFEAKKGLFLYPENTNNNNTTTLTMYLNRGITFKSNVIKRDDVVLKLGLNIPTNTNSYEDFVSKIKKMKKFLKNKLLNL